MNTETINIKIDRKTKQAAQRVAKGLGFSLSSIVKAYLRQLIQAKEINFSARSEEEPTKYLLKVLRESEADIKAGRVTSFHSVDEALAHLDKKIMKNESGADRKS